MVLFSVAEPKYLFSAPTPAPPLSIISAPAPAPAPVIFCHLKLYYNSSTIRSTSQWKFFFILASSKLTAVNFYQKYNVGSRSQIISAPPAPAPQHCYLASKALTSFLSKCRLRPKMPLLFRNTGSEPLKKKPTIFRALKLTFILDDCNKRKKRAGEIWALVSQNNRWNHFH